MTANATDYDIKYLHPIGVCHDCKDAVRVLHHIGLVRCCRKCFDERRDLSKAIER